jgi:hypothetical protein
LLAVAIDVAVQDSLPFFSAPTSEERHLTRHPFWGVMENQSPQLASRIEQLVASDEQIYVFGHQDELYFYTNHRPAIRWIHSAVLWMDPYVVDATLRLLNEAPPALIIDSAWALHQQGIIEYPAEIRAFLESHYKYLDHIAYADVWRLRAADSDAVDNSQLDPVIDAEVATE